jgi:hypothetical protein
MILACSHATGIMLRPGVSIPGPLTPGATTYRGYAVVEPDGDQVAAFEAWLAINRDGALVQNGVVIFAENRAALEWQLQERGLRGQGTPRPENHDYVGGDMSGANGWPRRC